MTTNNPEVKRYALESGHDSMMRKVNRMQESEGGVYVRFEDYEALQAENEQLVEELEDALTSLEKYAVMVDGEWGCFRDLGQLEADDELPQCVKDARAALAAHRKQGEKP